MRPPRTTFPRGLWVPFLLLAVLAQAPVASAQEPSLPSQLDPEVRSRLAEAAQDSKLESWQRDFMLGVARGRGEAGTTDALRADREIALSPPGLASSDGAWASVPFVSPSGRNWPTTIYDPVRDRMVVFGGTDGSPHDDVWELSLAGNPAWSQLTPAGSAPSARWEHTAIYDPLRDRMVVFGGIDGSPRNDVWALSLAGSPAWTEITAAGSPPSARYGHSAFYDPGRDRMVVFGGWDGGGTYSNDVWALSLAGSPAWSALSATGTPPPARSRHTAIYDPVRDRMVVFGGGNLVTLLNDVWALSLGGSPAWSALTPAGSPPAPRYLHTAIYDPIRDRVVVFGGSDDTGTRRNDVWALPLAGSPAWSALSPAGSPPSARYFHAAIYDPVRDRMVTFAGHDGGFRNDVWALSLSGSPAWSEPIPAWSPPSARYYHSTIYDPVRDRMVVFGGYVGSAYLSDVWVLSLAGSPVWSMLVPTGSPPPARQGLTAIYDPVRDRMVVFGGFGDSDVWALSLAGSPGWSVLAPTGSPPSAREGHTAIYDPIRDRMVVFGGFVGSGYASDVWALSLAGSPAWSMLAPAGSPPLGRCYHTAIYDPVRDRMVVFGGTICDGFCVVLNDTWELSLAGSPTWSALAPGGSLHPARYLHTAIYDPVRDRMVVFAGNDHNNNYRNEAWALSLGANSTWSALAPAGSLPSARIGHTAIYDPVRDRMVVFGGHDGSPRNDVWVLLNDTTAPTVLVLAPDGGEMLDNATPIPIAWAASDNVNVAHVDIYGSTNSGSTYSLLAAGEANDGSYAWNGAPLTTQGRVLVVAFDASGNSATDASDGDFTISDPAPPAIPAPFIGVFTGGPVQLHWGASSEGDFALYHLHRGTTSAFVPGPGNLVVSQPDTGFVDNGSTWSYYKLSALDVLGHESGFALVTPAGQAVGATPPGTGVQVSLASNVQLTFQNVTSGGQSQLSLQTGGSPPPDGLRLAPTSPRLYYVLSTTATFTGTVTVCVTYDPANVTGPEANLRMMHFDTEQIPQTWVPVTTSRDVVANVICGTVTHFSEFALMELEPGVDVTEAIPSAFRLLPCAPNPVSGTAQIRYDLPVASPVRLGVFDLQGRQVRELERQSNTHAGRHAVTWDGRGDHGERLRAGVYFLRFEARGFQDVQRVSVTN